MIKLKGLFVQSGIISKMLILIGFAIVFTVFGVFVWTLFKGTATDINSLKLMQLMQSLGMFVLPPFVFAYFCTEKPMTFLHLDKKLNWLHIGFVVLFMLVIIPAINLLTSLNQQMVLPKAFAGIEAWMKSSEEQLAKFTEQLVNVHSLGALTFNIFLIALIPAFGEELFFRGTIQGVFKQKTHIVFSIWMTAAIFSAIHMQFYGFFPRLLLGAFFGYLLFWSENLWLPVVGHFVNNGVAILFYYLKCNGYRVPDIDSIGTGNSMWIGLLSLCLGVFGFFFLRSTIFIRNTPKA